jgi:hypothetical protein
MSLGVIPSRDEAFECFDRLLNRTEVAMSEHSASNDCKPQLDLIEPRAVGRSVVEDESVAMTMIPVAEEGLDWRVLVSIEVIQDHVERSLEKRHVRRRLGTPCDFNGCQLGASHYSL